MPSPSVRRRAAARRDITDEPVRLARRGLSRRGQRIQVSAAQHALQAVLFECFTYPQREHPWDARGGRRLPGLFASYGTWVSPQPDRVAFGTTVAARMCAFLLPYAMVERDGHAYCAGIPGLRLTRHRQWGYELIHLPTGIAVEIHEGRMVRAEALAVELACRDRDIRDGLSPVWEHATLSDAERHWDHVWQPQPHTEAASVLFMGHRAFQYSPGFAGPFAQHLQLTPAQPGDVVASVEWCSGPPPEQVVATLDALGLGLNGEPFAVERYGDGLLQLGSSIGPPVELRRRRTCAHCHRRPTFEPADRLGPTAEMHTASQPRRQSQAQGAP